MAFIWFKPSLLLLSLFLFSGFASARDVLLHRRSHAVIKTECWTAMLELRSCTDEIILFFLNGEAYLGQDCCRAIRVITRQCWPSMFTSLGFTAEEGDILRGYCDATTPAAPPPQISQDPSDPPAAAPAPLAPTAV